MFSFIKFFIGLSFLMSFNFSVQAQIPDSSYTTLRGFTFKQVVVPKLGQGWQDAHGRVWSQYQGEFSNRGTLGTRVISQSGDREVVDSAAVESCRVIGAKLPTRDEYQSLFDSFESTAEFVKLFPKPGSSSNLIWTSNAHLVEFVRFVKFSPLDPFGDVAQSQRRLSVYCVK